MSGPMAGVRIVELGQMIAVPAATHLLATQGAEVVKVENVLGGDDLRRFGSGKGGMSGWFANANAGKRAIAVDLESSAGKAVLAGLIDRADVFVQGFRPGSVDRLGLGYDAVAERNPRLVYVSASGFGGDGPYAGRPVYDPIIQAVAGWAGGQTLDDGSPSLVRGMVADKVAAMTVAQAITAALHARSVHGEGQHVEVSMLEANLAFNWPDVMMHETVLDDDALHLPNLLGSYRLFACTDGWVSLAAGTDRQWSSLCRACDRDDLLDDERFTSPQSRAANFPAWYGLIGELAAAFARDDLIQRCVEADVPIAPVYAPGEVVNDAQVAHRGAIVERDHPLVGRYRAPRQGAAFGRDTTTEPRPAPDHGEHTDELLTELGHDAAAIAELRDSGVVR
ncbi:MAG: CoA transferase [Actinomycetota bacterium]